MIKIATLKKDIKISPSKKITKIAPTKKTLLYSLLICSFSESLEKIS